MPDSGHAVVTTASGLFDLVGHLRTAGRFAFDTEFVSEDSFEPVLGLIQVATRERVAAIDAIAIPDLTPFWDVLTDPDVTIVMHAAGEDLRICLLKTGRLPSSVIDVQIAAGLVGYGYPISLTNLVRSELAITLAGGETRTDWRKRPLSSAQLRYALDDVRHLLDLASRLGARLEDWGRADWAAEEYRALLGSVEDRCADTERWRRLPGLHQLSRRGLEIARRLDQWRREQARQSDRPLRQILRDDLLVGIAKRQPTSRRDLEALRDFQRPHLLSRSRELLDLIAEALLVPADQLPEHAERFEEPPGQSMVVNLLAAALNQCCTERRVAGSLVGSANDLKELVRWHLDGTPESWRPAVLTGWRGTVAGEILQDVLSGRRALRIVDPAAELPVALDPGPD